jgi:hypothetical protein
MLVFFFFVLQVIDSGNTTSSSVTFAYYFIVVLSLFYHRASQRLILPKGYHHQMPRISKRAIFIRELGDVVVSHHVFADAHKLLCEDLDSEFDDDEILNTKAIAAIQYTAVQNFRYLYRATSYHADIRGRRSSYAMPEWKKIVLGYKYNEEEFLRIF